MWVKHWSFTGALSYFGEKKVRYFYTGLIFAGGILVLLGIFGYRTGSNIPRFWKSTTARVVYSERTTQDAFIPTVEFTLPQGENITAASRNSFRRSLDEGEEVRIRYNPLQPEEIVVERNTLLSYPIYLFFGIVLSGFGFRLFVTSLMMNYRIAFIKENGKRVIPYGITLEEAWVRILFVKRRAYFLRCPWKNPLAGSHAETADDKPGGGGHPKAPPGGPPEIPGGDGPPKATPGESPEIPGDSGPPKIPAGGGSGILQPGKGPAEEELVFTGGPYSTPPPLQENGFIGGKKVIVYFMPRNSAYYYIEWQSK